MRDIKGKIEYVKKTESELFVGKTIGKTYQEDKICDIFIIKVTNRNNPEQLMVVNELRLTRESLIKILYMSKEILELDEQSTEANND